MLYFKFKNFEEFKQVFEVRTCGNGAVQRRNKILLRTFRNTTFFRWCIRNLPQAISCDNMADFKKSIYDYLKEYSENENVHKCELHNGVVLPQSELYLDERKGLTEDEVANQVRYINHTTQRIMRGRAGGFFSKAILSTPLGEVIPQEASRWLEEDFAQSWGAYCKAVFLNMTLHVSSDRDAFKKIYDSRYTYGDFHSCMVNENQDSFYYDAVQAKAAWLTNSQGYIVARCIIFTEVFDEDGKIYRLAERQYSTEQSNDLKRALVDALINAGEIDGYKQVGVDCHNARSFVSTTGESLSHKDFHIKCNLNHRGVLSYQDTFKFFDPINKIAYNYDGEVIAADRLDRTDSRLSSITSRQHFSSFNGCWIPREQSHRDPVRNDFFYPSQVVLVDGRWRYREDMSVCSHCGEYFDPKKGEVFESELTYGVYCSESCMHSDEEAYLRERAIYSDYDERYCFDKENVFVSHIYWNGSWIRYTVHRDSFAEFSSGLEVRYVDNESYVGTVEQLDSSRIY